jgi:RNA polymerase sigma-70 factor (ECF subfamily)
MAVEAMQTAHRRGERRYRCLHHFRGSRVYMDMTTDTLVPHASDATADWGELRTRLRAFVARRVGDQPATHEDLVQDILVRLHRGLPKLRQTDRLDAFAYQIARNAIADHHRRGRREDPVAPEDLDNAAPASDADGEDSGEGRTQLANCLRPLVDRLDDDYREALLLTDLGDLSQAEAARRLGISAPGMRSRVQRGRAQVEEALGRCCQVELDAASQIDAVDRVGPCACND